MVCALFVAPLVLTLYIFAQRLEDEFDFNTREFAGIEALKDAWRAMPQGGTPDGVRRIREVGEETLILDNREEAYRLAHALTSSLIDLAVAPAAAGLAATDLAAISRFARVGAQDLQRAAEATPTATIRTRLLQRAEQLRALASSPQGRPAVQTGTWWTETLADLQHTLEVRRAGMIRRATIQVLLIAAFAIAACYASFRIVHGLSGRVARLVAQIDRLIANDTTGPTPFLDDRHEVGQLAKGVEALRRSMIDARGAWGDVLLIEMRYSLLADNMREVVLVCDRQGVIQFASPSVADFTGGGSEVEGSSVWALFGPQDGPALSEAVSKAGEDEVKGSARYGGAPDAAVWGVTVRHASDEDDGLVFVLAPPRDA